MFNNYSQMHGIGYNVIYVCDVCYVWLFFFFFFDTELLSYRALIISNVINRISS